MTNTNSTNWRRLMIAGLLAGLVILFVEGLMNTVILGPQMEQEMAAHNIGSFGAAGIVIMNLWCLAMGIATAWLYVTFKPAFGAGTATGVKAGLFVWAMVYIAAGIPQLLMGIFSPGLMVASFASGLVEFAVAGFVAAKMYREHAGAPLVMPARA